MKQEAIIEFKKIATKIFKKVLDLQFQENNKRHQITLNVSESGNMIEIMVFDKETSNIVDNVSIYDLKNMVMSEFEQYYDSRYKKERIQEFMNDINKINEILNKYSK